MKVSEWNVSQSGKGRCHSNAKKQPLIDYDSHNVSEDESTCVIDVE